jgi:hypothetical protein
MAPSRERVVIEIIGMSYFGYVLGGSTSRRGREFTTGRAQAMHHILILDWVDPQFMHKLCTPQLQQLLHKLALLITMT